MKTVCNLNGLKSLISVPTCKKTAKLKGTFTKNFSKPLKSHILTLSILKILPITRHFGRTFYLSLHKRS